MRGRVFQSTHLKRILSFILCLGLMVGYLPQGVMADTDLARIEIEFADAIEMEGTAEPSIRYFNQLGEEMTAKGAAVSYEISPEGILTEVNGVFTPVKLGSATVTATATVDGITKSASTRVAVVGKNLIYNKNAPASDEGSFEGLLYTSDIKSGDAFTQRYWLVYSAANGTQFSASASYDTTKENVRHGNQSLKIACDSATNGATQRFKAELCRNLIAITPGHLYELSGYVKAQDIKNDSGVNVSTMYADKDSTQSGAFANASMNRALYLSKTPYNNPAKYPLEQVITDDGSWQKFTVPASLPTDDTLTHCKLVLMNANTTANGTYWFDELRFREVVFDRLDFTIEDDTSTLKAGDTLTTAVKFYSNTGNELVYSAGSALPTVTYATTDDQVATVDTDGKITITGAGRAEITAETTIAGVTCQGKIAITVSEDAATLDPAKTAALSSLQSAFEGYSESKYTEENWLLLTAAKDTGVLEINAAITSNEVTDALNKAVAAMAAIDKKPVSAEFESVTIELPDEIEMESTVPAVLKLSDADSGVIDVSEAAISYEIQPEGILTEANGVFTPVKLGSATVTATATVDGITKSASTRVAVVGKNLIYNKNVPTADEGSFEGLLYTSDITSGDAFTQRYWLVYSSVNGSQFSASASYDTTEENVRHGNQSLKIACDSATNGATQRFKAELCRNLIAITPGHLYELTGYVKAQNITTESGISVNTMYADKDSTSTSAFANASMNRALYLSKTPYNNPAKYPLEQGITDDGSWQKFTVPASLPTDETLTHCKLVIMNENTTANGTYWFDELRFREVVFDRLDFTTGDDTSALKAGDTLTTAVKFYSNTGNELVYSAGSALPTVTYATTDDQVATVDTDGKITITGAGNAKISAEVTIAGVTCKGEIALTVAQDTTALNAAKTDAKSELTAEFAKYKESDYTSENWLLLTAAKDQGVTAIEAASNIAAVDAALDTAKTEMAKIAKKPAAATLQSVSLSYGKNEFVVGESESAVLSGTMSDESSAVLTGATISYSSTQPSVLEVGEDGTITAKAVGDAIIHVSVTLDGNTATADVPITVTAPKLARVELSVPGQIALYTTAKSTIKLFDEKDQELSLDGAAVSYQISDSSYFEISDSGIITAKKLGDATLTATVTRDGVEKSSDAVTVTVATRGENLIIDANADFEEDMTFDGTAASTGRPWLNVNIADRFTKYEVKTCPRDGNADNKALALTIQEGKTGNPDALRLTYDKRAVLEEGKFYELSFWIKSELNVPEGSAQPYFYADMYTYYTNGETSSATTGTNFRNFEVQTTEGYPFDGEWTLITIPVTAPLQNTANPGGPIYATPRIHMRVGKSSGVTGTMWIDDIQLREVGFDHVEAAVSGDIESGKANLVIKPYATSGTMIAMLYSDIPSYVSVESDQPAIIEAGSAVSTASKNVVAWATAPLTNIGKGGTANVKATVELCGIEREATVPITVEAKKATLKSVSLSFDKSEYALGDTAAANVQAIMTDDNAADLTQASVTYRSSNTSVLDISGTGVITPKSEGETTITVTVTIEGVAKTATAPLSVIDASALKTVTLDAPEKLFYGDEATLSVSGTMTSGNAAYLPNATVVYSIVEQSEDGAISLDASTGKIKGLKIDSTAKVKATMTIRGVSVDSNITEIRILERKPLTVTLGIAGQESNIVPVGTAQTMQVGLRDVNGDAIDPADASVQYSVSPVDAATVLDGGVLDIQKLGDITVTATATVGEHTASASYVLSAQNAGENLFADLNPEFDTDEWVWQNAFSNEPNGQLVRGTIGIAPRDGDASNRALGLRLDPAVTATSANADILRLKFAKRIKVQAGKLYELSFWVKVDTDYYDDFNQYIDIYEYKNKTGESSSDVTGSYPRNMDLKTYVTGKADGWVKVTLPVSAPLTTDNADGSAYLSPRFSMFRPLSGVVGKSGLDGVIWFDDFQLREVGLGEIKTELTGDTSAVESVAKLTIMPYTTTGTQIAVTYNKAGEVCSVTSSDPDVASVSEVRSNSNKNEVAWECADVKIVGKNGTTQLTTAVNLAGVTRTAVTSLTTSDLPTVLRELKIQVENPNMLVDTTQKITLAAILTDGTSSTDLGGAKTALYSSDGDVVEVDQEGNLTALREGESVIRADINMDGIIRSAEVTITVTDESGIASAALSVPETIMEGRPTKMLISGLMASGKELCVENAQINYVIEEMSEAGCIEISDSGMITGKKAGTTARVRADVTLRGKTVSSAPVTISIAQGEPSDLVIDFKNYVEGVNVVGAVSLEKDGWEANTEKTSQFCLNTAKFFRFLKYGIQAQIQKVDTPIEADSAFDIRIPYTGDYTFSFFGADFAAGASVAAIFIDGEYVGEYNFYDAENNYDTWGPNLDMKSVHLESGVHTVIIRSMVRGNNGRGNANQYPSCMTFKGLEKLPEFEGLKVVFGQGALSVGDTTTVSASLCYDNGVAVKAFPGLEADGSIDHSKEPTYENLTPDVLSLNADGSVTTLKEGVGKIRANAYVNGVLETVEGEITVRKRVLDSVTVTAEKTQLFVGDTCAISAEAFFSEGVFAADVKPVISSDNEAIVSVSGNKTLQAKAVGTANITATAEFDGVTKTASVTIRVAADGLAEIELTADPTTMKPTDAGAQISIKALSNKGIQMPLDGAKITYAAEDEAIVAVSESGFVTPKAIGGTKVTVTVQIGDNIATQYLYFSVTLGKTESTIYTPEMVANARANVSKYNWAWAMKESAVKAADQYVNLADKLWKMVPGEGIPRSTACGFVDEPYAFTCRYCGCDLRAKYGLYSWILDPLNDPWKVRCPDCRRAFPSNDFAGFYELGLDEHGVFNRELAKQRNDELVASGEDGYLKNILYPEKDAELGVTNWGVDDGFGYVTGKSHTLSNGKTIEERHTYIAYYMEYGLWCTGSTSKNGGILVRALQNLRDAYLYTGDERYGRTGAILIDRIADVYPDYDLRPYYMGYKGFQNSHGGSGQGKILGRIWEAQQTAPDLARAYDAFYPMMDDPQVVSFLNEKAVTYQLSNDKSTPEKIRQNSEDNILREIYKGCKDVSISGNFGMMQIALGLSAVALDTMPETAEWIDFVMQPGTTNYSSDICTGGNVLPALINQIGRDGIGDENAPGYNYIWLSSLIDIADTFSNYKKYDGANLWENPKMQAMLPSWLPLILCSRYQVQIGDSGAAGNTGTHLKLDDTLTGYINTQNPVLAQATYWLNGNSTSGLHTDIFTKDPEKIQADIANVIDEYGEYDFAKSTIQPSWGLAVLRDGSYNPSGNTAETYDTQRDFWIYFGRTSGHGHTGSMLNLGIHAYGLDMAPDLGYPEATGQDPNRMQWVNTSLSHTAVSVNDKNQATCASNGTPLHFDDTARVKVMDIDAPQVFADTDIYRRTVVMIQVDDEVSYGLDFFRIQGGGDHLYSFHAASHESTTENLNLVEQVGGSYAGINVPWGENAKYMNGYTWLDEVRSERGLKSGNFAVDFKIGDFRNILPRSADLHLRMTMLNDFNLSEVSLAKGTPPRTSGNQMMGKLEYVLARRTAKSGESLDTLFTTVFEPYENERYVESMERVDVVREDGRAISENEKVSAVRVFFKNGRVDTVIYAHDNTVSYLIDGEIPFRGFIGVITEVDGTQVYSYLNDGDKLADANTDLAAYTGTVTDFTKELTTDNSIIMTLDQTPDTDELIGRCVQITNDGAQNAYYQIEDASVLSGNTVKLDVGNNTLIRSLADSTDMSKGYVYNIAEGQSGRIALSYVDDSSPVIAEISDKQVEAGSELRFQVSAESPLGKTLSYSAKRLPRGANFDAASATFSWIPDGSQVGQHSVTLEVSDGLFASSIIVPITVYHSAAGGGTSSINKEPGNSTQQVDPKPPVVTTEKDEVSFAASTNETTAETKLGTVTFADGTFAADGQGKLKIERENETYTVSVTATVDMAEQPAKVSLNYTPADNMTDENCIIVKDENGNIIPNGRYENGKMTFYTEKLGKFSIVYNPKSFTDLENHAWASGAITRLAARGIINGITPTTYGPSKNITRADFTTLIVRAFGFTAETTSFADIPANAYYAEPVGIAKTLGIVGGVNETDFAPTSEITRQDMMVIVARALEKAGYVLGETENAEFSDMHEVADYAKDAVEILTKSGLIAGSNGKINPKGNTTRAEVAVILDRIVFMKR